MDDLISRQAAITLFEKYGAKEDAIALLNSLPPAQQGWIPCSERPPEKSEWYLLTAEWDDGLTTVMKDRYVVGEGWTCAVFGAKCLAWQSLPTPYREGRQDDH